MLKEFIKMGLGLLVAVAFNVLVISPAVFAQSAKKTAVLNFIYTSDAHYGITRSDFRGAKNVSGHTVNSAMIAAINELPKLKLPADNGANSGNVVGGIEYLIEGGDIANRMEIPIQSATASWKEFESDYVDHLNLKQHNGSQTELLLIPGNHDISNAIGHYKAMQPIADPASMVNIYNKMIKPEKLITSKNYDYNLHKVNYCRNVNGVHIAFINLWPDSAERIWLKNDLDTVSSTTPVIIFTHDPPICDAKHFTNPVSPYGITERDKFENLVVERYKEAKNETEDKGMTDIEQRGFVKFLKAYPNIKAYFHGHSNSNEFYIYHGPDQDVNLNVFRVDSPMKGKYSSKDEKLLSFQLISLDAVNMLLTVRECLWNTEPLNPSKSTTFGNMITISLR
ncbi:MAG: metallophosphoesterase [Candidatus Pedobacter colombiensis]|uniref:Metallophosphoesterase n=1 Tax=Candidatus Pedobacter colombiensis TaxID=3121371 RepID=A0AAJ6B873_9SPHI|nr:metallophosphoesterase [Pedobacter sp.]WEK21045.1 MAG: metallophosphoesterase [Pedobacter sp.]